MGMKPPPGDGLQGLADEMKEVWRQIRVLQRPTGTSIAGLVEQVRLAIVNIGSTVTGYLAGGFTTGSMTATGNIVVNGTSRLVGQVTSPGVAATNVTLVPGTRSAVWVVDASGLMGQTNVEHPLQDESGGDPVHGGAVP